MLRFSEKVTQVYLRVYPFISQFLGLKRLLVDWWTLYLYIDNKKVKVKSDKREQDSEIFKSTSIPLLSRKD